MSEASYMEDGGEYYDIYNNDDDEDEDEDSGLFSSSLALRLAQRSKKACDEEVERLGIAMRKIHSKNTRSLKSLYAEYVAGEHQ